MIEFFTDLPRYAFLQHALIAAALASIPCGIVGSFIVVRRSTYIAGAISHSLLAGMGLALYLKVVHGFQTLTPLHGAVAAAITAALLVGAAGASGNNRVDTVLSVIWSVGMALGISFIMATPGYNEDLMSYLFGNILMVSPNDLILMAVLNGVVVVSAVLFYTRLVTISFHRELAVLRGINVSVYEQLFLILTALTIVLLVNVVGIVMAIALLTLPAATTGNVFNRLSRIILSAIALCMILTVGGLVISYGPEWPAGPTIIELAGLFYLLSLAWRRLRKRRLA